MTNRSSQNKYLAYELTRKRSSTDDGKFTGVLAEAQVDLNPHQVEAALFAFRSPLSMGAILADEVGLGKTIEAGLVISQHWAECKRKILIIVPATLRRQWSIELEEKFFLPSLILEKKNFDRILNDTYSNPFDQKENIIICSYPFARKHEAHLSRVDWDLVVIDEAHKLRNVYKTGNKTALALKYALQPFKKILLTATPLQNDIKELYGLVSIIDDSYFGSLSSFGSQYSKVALRDETTYTELRDRLLPIVHRTLRADVQEYVKYTKRQSMVQVYTPTNDEQALYEIITDYLRKDNSYGLPNSQRQLISMVMFKLMASSTFAIAGTLTTIINRLKRLIESQNEISIIEDDELYEEYAEEWLDEENEDSENLVENTTKQLSLDDKNGINEEIKYLQIILDLALSIANNSKGECLLTALYTGFSEMDSMGASRKALIFTESTRTQNYLYTLLEANGYKDKIVLFNGSNNDIKSRAIYKEWVANNRGTGRITGSATADKRQAIIDYFRNSAEIMIATEAAAEGINLQFCSLLVNYDLPWNPQRVEQRIGRCHRYGQKYDVVVVNFINTTNRADQRVFELLDQKFQLFKGVFGASDDVLGLVENSVDFEKRILSIYRDCRTPEQIDEAFDRLQEELRESIDKTMETTQKSLIENFDEDVITKLRLRKNTDVNRLNSFNRLLWFFTKNMLNGKMTIENEDSYQFNLKRPPLDFSSGVYGIGKGNSGINYRISHPLAQYIIREAKTCPTPSVSVVFNYTEHRSILSVIEQQKGNCGWLTVQFMKLRSLKEDEEYIVSVAIDSDGNVMSDDFVGKLMSIVISSSEPVEVDSQFKETLDLNIEVQCNDYEINVSERNSVFIDQEVIKIENWAEDNRKTLQQTLKDLDKEIDELNREFVRERNIRKKLAVQERKDTVSNKRDDAWREFDRQREILKADKQKLINNLYQLADQENEVLDSFIIKWRIV